MGEGEDGGIGATGIGAPSGVSDAMGGEGLSDGFGAASFGSDGGMSSWGLQDIAFDTPFQSFNDMAADWGLDSDLNGINMTAQSMPDVSWSDSSSTESWLGKLMGHPAFQALAAIASKSNPTLGLALGLGKAFNSSNPSQSMLGFMGNTVGNATMGFGVPGFGVGNGMAGLAGMATAGAGSPAATSEGNSGQWGSVANGLGGLFANYMGMRDNQKMLGGLQSLYSKNSPYSQQLRQQLERRDAAGGRRSQYGPREVELQAKLAQMASGQIPAMAQLQNNRTMMRNQMLQSGLYAAQKSGLLNGLGSLFSNFGSGGGASYVPQEGSMNFMGPPSSDDMFPDFSLPSFMGT